MSRFVTDPTFLGPAIGVVAKEYGDDPDWDDLYWKWIDDMDNNPGPSKYVGQGHFNVGDIIHDYDGLVRIIAIVAKRGGCYSTYEYLPLYKVQPITKKGQWSKRWHYTFPGIIQRAYEKAQPVTITQQYAAGSYDSYSVDYGDEGGLHRGLPEAREEAAALAKKHGTTVVETLKDWRSI